MDFTWYSQRYRNISKVILNILSSSLKSRNLAPKLIFQNLNFCEGRWSTKYMIPISANSWHQSSVWCTQLFYILKFTCIFGVFPNLVLCYFTGEFVHRQSSRANKYGTTFSNSCWLLRNWRLSGILYFQLFCHSRIVSAAPSGYFFTLTT